MKSGFRLEHVSTLLLNQSGSQPVALVDLVLEGGGAKGIALVGALYALELLGLRWRRVGGTSAGSIIAALITSNTRHYLEPKAPEIIRLMNVLDMRQFFDGGAKSDLLLDSLASRSRFHAVKKAWGVFRNAGSLRRHLGVVPGNSFSDYLNELAADNFLASEANLQALRQIWLSQAQDVADAHPGFTIDELLPDFQSVTFDVMNYRKAVLPRDLGVYLSNPDDVNIFDLVRASVSIPLVFAPVKASYFIRAAQANSLVKDALFVDGGLVENFPLRLFDRADSMPAKCPTIGVLIDEEDKFRTAADIKTPTGLLVNIIKGVIEQQWHQLESTDDRLRTVRISNRLDDMRYASMIDFNMPQKDSAQLFLNGAQAAFAMIREFRPYAVGAEGKEQKEWVPVVDEGVA